MKNKLKVIISMVLYFVSFFVCENIGERASQTIKSLNWQNKTISANNFETKVSINSQDSEISDSIKLLEMIWDEARERVVVRIKKIAQRSPEKKTEVVKELISEVKRMCAKGSTNSWGELVKVQAMSGILADLKSEEAIDVLVDCAGFSTTAVTGGLGSYGTQIAIIKYKEKAIPALKKKLLDGDWETKLQIPRLLSETGKPKAEEVLKEAQKTETDEDVLDRISISLNYFNNLHKENKKEKLIHKKHS